MSPLLAQGYVTALRSYWAGMKAAARIGRGVRNDGLGDHHAAMVSYRKALEAIRQPGVDVNTPWCRPAVSASLYGFAVAATNLELHGELVEVLVRWRPEYQAWLKQPLTPGEGAWLAWVESVYQYLVRTRSL